MSETMTAKNRMHFASGLIGALVLAIALPGPASAQQSDPWARTAKSDPTAATRPAPKPAKPVVRPGAEQNAKTNAKTPEAQGRPWTLQDAMPDHSASMRQYDTRPASPGMGRVPLQSGPGTLAFE